LRSLDREGAPQAVVAWGFFRIPKGLKGVDRREAGRGAGVHAPQAEFPFRLILFHLFSAPVLRFSELRRAMVGISQKMLIQQLRDLEKDGVVAREVYPEVPPKVEYKLTKDGMALRAALKALKSWAASRDARLSVKGAAGYRFCWPKSLRISD
jgi:DNA-binding HxlR family transcriptional regulator